MATKAKQAREGENKIDGLWRFRVDVQRFVGVNYTQEANLLVDYRIYLNFEGSEVKGSLVGVREIRASQNHNTTSYGKVTGTIDPNGNIKFKISYTQKGQIGFEVFEGKKTGELISGQLKAGKAVGTFRNYEGPVSARRMKPSDFDS